MAGDWIKMRIDLQTHPKIVRILSATGSDKFRAIGGLHAVWGVFDQHSEDGALHGYTPELMDHIIGWPGFSAAMIAVGWMVYDGKETLSMPEFTEHNGKSAKRRGEDQKRKKDSRKRPQSVRTPSANDADKKRTREEKRREYIKPPLSPFENFWKSYPKKRGKGTAEKAWKKTAPDAELCSRILAALEIAKQSRDWQKQGGDFIPYPATWLNARGWEDEHECNPASSYAAGAI